MDKSHRRIAMLVFLALAAPLSAQSSITPGVVAAHENRVRMGIVVPLGRAGREAERLPRLELWGDQGRNRPIAPLRLSDDPATDLARPARIGFTFARQPTMMFNGREAVGLDDRYGVSTMGVVGIGIAVGVVVLGVALLGAAADANN